MALVDSLAKQLSEKTGTQFEVLRGRPEACTMYGVQRGPMRYGLRAVRDGVPYTFQGHRPLTLNELTRWLATINDMVSMGFIPVSRANSSD